jgi:hypothetical protein
MALLGMKTVELTATPLTEDQVQRGFFLNVVVRKGAAIRYFFGSYNILELNYKCPMNRKVWEP